MTELDRAHRYPALLLTLTLCFSACADDDFPVYNELEGLRVLAIRAEPPALEPGGEATLDALLFDEAGNLEDVRHAWSWCPARLPASQGADCAVTEEEVSELTGVDVSFDLGEERTATLRNELPEALIDALCETSAQPGQEAERDFVLDCDEGLPLSVKLVVERGGQRITSIKEVRLLAEAGMPETNPRIDDVAFVRVPKGVEDEDIKDEVEEGDAEPLAQDGSSRLDLATRYRLFADVPSSASDRFVSPPKGFEKEGMEKLENLALSWFVSSGETDKERTAFTDGSSKLEAIRPNTWRLPKAGDEDADTAQLILVIRDERGGVNWLTRSVELAR